MNFSILKNKKIFSLIIMFFLTSVLAFGKYKLIMSDNASGKLDINRATQEEMLRSGVAESYVRKIISFRDIKGGIESIDELSRVSGIGEKTCRKLEKYFEIKDVPKVKNLYITKLMIQFSVIMALTKKKLKK